MWNRIWFLAQNCVLVCKIHIYTLTPPFLYLQVELEEDDLFVSKPKKKEASKTKQKVVKKQTDDDLFGASGSIFDDLPPSNKEKKKKKKKMEATDDIFATTASSEGMFLLILLHPVNVVSVDITASRKGVTFANHFSFIDGVIRLIAPHKCFPCSY